MSAVAWMLVAATTSGPAATPGSAPVEAMTAVACAGDEDGPLLELGPADAPTVIDAYLDPADAGSLITWIELRRLVADLRGGAKVAVHFVRGLGPTEPRADQVRAWVVASASRGHVLPALRLVARDGEDRLFMRLHDPEQRQALADELGHEGALATDSEAMRRGWQRIRRATEALSLRHAGRRTAVYRLPVFALDEISFEDSPTLDRLRWELAKQGPRLREARDRAPPRIPQPKAASDRMRRPPLRGSMVGGSGLPHRFVLMARDEDDPNLVMLLPPVLEFRRESPAVLSVHVVARGTSIGGQRLRHRLCAARRLGLDLDYVRFLAIDPASRRFPSPTQEGLLEQLDAVDEKACADEPDPADLGLPDGGWLDGIPRNRSELESLELTLRLLDAAARPLSTILSPPRETDL